jgi:hypothetical protein
MVLVEEDFSDTITPEDNKVFVYGEQQGQEHTKNNVERKMVQTVKKTV